MSGSGGRKIVWKIRCLPGLILLGMLWLCPLSFGAERLPLYEIPGGDWSELDRFLQQQGGEQEELFSFSELVKALME